MALVDDLYRAAVRGAFAAGRLTNDIASEIGAAARKQAKIGTRKILRPPATVYRHADIPRGYAPVTDGFGRIIDKYVSETYIAPNPAAARQKLQKLASNTALNMDSDAAYALIIGSVISQVSTNPIKEWLSDEFDNLLGKDEKRINNAISYRVSANVRAYK